MSVQSADVLQGNADPESGNTFTFQIAQSTSNNSGTNIYLAAAATSTGQSGAYALSSLNQLGKQVRPLALQEVKLNQSAEKVTNPIFNQGITRLTLMEEPGLVGGAVERPIVVLANNPTSAYLTMPGNDIHVYSADNVPDATGQVTNGIISIEALRTSAAAAVLANGSTTFGDLGSGIALLLFNTENEQTVFQPIDALTGKTTTTVNQARAFPIDRSSSLLKIQNNLASIENTIDMYWDTTLQVLFVGFEVQSGSTPGDGARGVIVGMQTSAGIRFYPIAIDNVFDATANKIVGIAAADQSISINKIRTMHTTTGLAYLIVQGGNGIPAATKQSVYALPIVSQQLNPNIGIGMIANAQEDPVNLSNGQRFVKRAFTQIPINPSQMPLATDVAVQVGGGALVQGDIETLFVQGDTVFVSVCTPDGSNQPGLFSSQALFNNLGVITMWTDWKRVANITDMITSAFLNTQASVVTFLLATSCGLSNTIKRTSWNDVNMSQLGGLQTAISTALPLNNAGVQGLYSFGQDTPGLSGISLLIATGFKKVLIAQTGYTEAGAFIPLNGSAFINTASFMNGTITQDFPIADTVISSIEGGILQDLGPIVAADIGVTPSEGYLFVGGSYGLAVLSKNDGSGWDTTTELANGLTGFTDGMSFKKVGNYKFVRKIIADGTFLYVLTDTGLDRIDLTQGAVGLGNAEITTLITPNTLSQRTFNGSFLDVVISEKFALLATSGGLFRIENGSDIRISIPAWTFVQTPEGTTSVTKIVTATQTGRAQDFARLNGSNVYVIGGYRGKDRARLYRFMVNAVDSGVVNDTTLQPFNDMFLINDPTYYVNLSMFRNNFGTDGASYFTTSSKEFEMVPALSLFPSFAQVGTAFVGKKSHDVAVAFGQGVRIVNLLRENASGSWIIGGDFGLLVNE